MTEAVPSQVEISRRAGVQTIRINRPEKKNALTVPIYAALNAALAAGEQDDDIAVHLIAGQPGAFCAGNDIEDFLGFARDGALAADLVTFLKSLARLDKPLVAAVDGLAIGIGTTLLLHCDLAYASERSLFRTPFLDLGVVPEAGSSLLAARLMGHVRAFELLVLGEPFDAAKALAVGLVNRVLPAAEVEPAALKSAEALAAKPREALRLARLLMKPDAQRAEILDRIDLEVAAFDDRLRSSEAQAAFAKFLTRKK